MLRSAGIVDETPAPRRGWLAWLTRPAALATSIGALAVATSWSLLLVDGASRQTTLANESTTSLTDALLAVGSSPVDGLLSLSPDASDANPAADSGATP